MTRYARLRRQYRRAKGTTRRMPAFKALRAFVKLQLRREVVRGGEEASEGQERRQARLLTVL